MLTQGTRNGAMNNFYALKVMVTHLSTNEIGYKRAQYTMVW